MTQYRCVNFDSEECLKHGVKNDLWMMQYQYDHRGDDSEFTVKKT